MKFHKFIEWFKYVLSDFTAVKVWVYWHNFTNSILPIDVQGRGFIWGALGKIRIHDLHKLILLSWRISGGYLFDDEEHMEIFSFETHI